MVVQPVGEAHCGERRERALASYGSLQSAVEQRQLDIGLCGRPRDEVETLENEPDAAVASIGQLRIGQLAHVDTIEAIPAACGSVEAADDVHQRALATTRCTHDRDEVA